MRLSPGLSRLEPKQSITRPFLGTGQPRTSVNDQASLLALSSCTGVSDSAGAAGSAASFDSLLTASTASGFGLGAGFGGSLRRGGVGMETPRTFDNAGTLPTASFAA